MKDAIHIEKTDPLTGETFIPVTGNQKFANKGNREIYKDLEREYKEKKPDYPLEHLIKKDKLTGEYFLADRLNKEFKTKKNQVAYNNLKAKQKRTKKREWTEAKIDELINEIILSLELGQDEYVGELIAEAVKSGADAKKIYQAVNNYWQSELDNLSESQEDVVAVKMPIAPTPVEEHIKRVEEESSFDRKAEIKSLEKQIFRGNVFLAIFAIILIALAYVFG